MTDQPAGIAELSRAGQSDPDALRPGELVAAGEPLKLAELYRIGRILTPWPTRRDCPRSGDLSGPLCRIEVEAPWSEALTGIEAHRHLQVLYFMHLARRDLLLQSPRRDGRTQGTFSLRSPVRPNPIASATVVLERVEGASLLVRGLDCVDGTPLIDLKPQRCPNA